MVVPESLPRNVVVSRTRVVWADANAESRDYVARLLSEHYEVEAVTDGEAAMTAVLRDLPEVLIMDLMIPKLDGFELLKRLRSEPRTSSLPVIMLSSHPGEEVRVEGFQAGADDYLLRPFSARELLARVESQIEMAQARKRMEDRLIALAGQLAEERDRLRAVLGSAKCLLWEAEIEDSGRGLLWSNARLCTDEALAQELLDVDRLPGETYLQAWRRARLPEDSERTHKNAITEIRNNRSFRHEFRVSLRNGEIRWLVEDVHIERVGEGRWQAVGVCMDLTPQKIVEERYRAVVESQSEMICRFRSDGEILFVNQAYARTLGSTAEALIHQSLWQFVVGEDRAGVQALLDQITPESPEVRIENRVETPNGARWTLWTNRGISFDSEGRATELQSTGIDITERKQADDALRRRQTEIEELNQRLRRAMTETHHRVKNNLQVIAGLVDIQLMDGAEQIPASEVKRIASHTRTLAAVHDLLTAEAKEAGDAHFLSSRAVLRKLVSLLELGSTGNPIEASFDDIALSARLSTSLALVTTELVLNAFKHGSGTVHVELRADDGSARLSVSDDGPGFPPDFDVRRAGNTGLDLVENLSRWDLAGSVTYANGLEGGACVTVAFSLGAKQLDSPEST